MAVGVSLMAMLLLVCEPSSSAANPHVIAVQIEKFQGGQSVLATRGSSTTKLGAGGYAVSTTVSRIPCPGRYRFDAESEDLRTGEITAYSAELVLSDFDSQPAGVLCRLAIPGLAGRASVVLSGGGTSSPLHLTGRRSGYGNFVGSLQVAAFPSCTARYELRSDFSLRDWSRTFSYEARFVQAELLYPGNVPEPPGCG